ncbi:MAG: phosphate/phosphite/phosphonate ABC transporter substrate-binding protein [Deltaproteobacteria bacterium]|nr:phosphate/phosphite/phosphonate ABC transporter substrate-binding protein [Deltaproteobacteria bacterium]
MGLVARAFPRRFIIRNASAFFETIVFLLFFLAVSSLVAPSVYAARQAPIRIGVSSMITPVDTVRYYQEIIEYIGNRIGQPVQMVHRRTYDEMDRLLERGEVKIAFICSAPYVKDREKFGVELLVAPRVNGSLRYHSYVIVHIDSQIRAFPELKGKAFAFTDPKSNTGKIYPTYLLKTMGFTPERFFGRIHYSYSHNKSVEMVAKRIAEGAAVDSIVYEHMRRTGSPYVRQTKIIKRSPPFGIPPVVVATDVDPILKKKVRDAFLAMEKDPKGKAILDAMMIDGFAEISDKDYDGIREMDRAIAGIVSAPKKTGDRRTVRFGIIPRDNPRILYEKYQPLIDYLSRKTPYSYEIVLKRNYAETVGALVNGETDVALLGPLTYLEARARSDVRCILKPRGVDGSAQNRSVIIKRKGAPMNSPSDLKGRSVAFASSKSTSGNLVPRYLLAESGIHLGDLKGYANFDFHDSVVKAVLKGRFDAGAVRESVAKKYLGLGIETIAVSEAIPTGPLVAGKNVSPTVVETIRKALLGLNPSEDEGRKVLKRLDEDLKNGFTEASERDYENIRLQINAVPRACGMGCHPNIRL